MRHTNEHGMALISTVLLLALVAALLVGFVEIITSDQRSGLVSRDQTQAYAAAHAGLEKLTSDLGQVFSANYAPTCNDIDALFAAGRAPVLPGISYAAPAGGSGYAVQYQCINGVPLSETEPREIASGPYQGFKGLITPYEVVVTARTRSGAEVRMRRELQTVAIPVFQFGMFSENDLSFFAGPDFSFGGRVHTNGNLFVAQATGSGTLTLSDRVTVWGEVVRKNLSNGYPTSTGYAGTVRVAKSRTQTTAMGLNQGSWDAATPQLPGVPTGVALEPQNGQWDNFSVSATNYYMRNARTGARRLDLPLAQMGALPIDLIRRPKINSAENTDSPAVFGQRYFAMASLRILLSDTAADLAALPTATSATPVDLGGAATTPPIARAPATDPAQQNYLTAAGAPLVTGFLKIEKQLPDRSWVDVTQEILNLGIAGRNLSNGTLNTPDDTTCSSQGEPHPGALIRLQRLKDDPAGTGCGNGSVDPTDYWPNVLYDAREGAYRDWTGQRTERRHFLGGIMHYVELDVANLTAWLQSQGSSIMRETGYVVYFSDRRGNWHDPGDSNRETGEYGFEDFVNPQLQAGYPGNGSYPVPATLASSAMPDEGEDLNGDGALQTYGATPFQYLAPPMDAASSPRPWTQVNWNYATATAIDATRPIVARVNPPIFFRRALKLVNGGLGNLPAPGLTVAAENPVYVQGNYNADASGFGPVGDGHQACAIIGDAVTLLSNQWNDINSFLSAHDLPGGNPGAGNPASPGRNATSAAFYRMAVIGGKGLSFQQPTWYTTYRDFGTDGGAHNFLRYLENWSAGVNYRGSIVSFYTSRQAVGTYKCCENVYDPPDRGYRFEEDFLTPSLLPPRTPLFRDVNTLQFRQVLRPTQ